MSLARFKSIEAGPGWAQPNRVVGISAAVVVTLCMITQSVSPDPVAAAPGSVKSSVPPELDAALRAVGPQARILGAKDIDAKSCGPLGKDPALVEADVNGDGRRDYAALLQIGDVSDKEQQQPSGEVWRWKQMHVWLVVFLGDEHGRFDTKVLERLDHYFPAIVTIAVQPAGLVREPESLGNRRVLLKNAGIARYFCEKSATVFYWDSRRGEFKQIGTAD
jgi:hypothetical protein